jgi:hypothetical protein
LDAALEVASILGRKRYDAKASTHWTFRSIRGGLGKKDETVESDGSEWACDLEQWNCGLEGFG